jgi:hypothetical protein
MKSVINSLNNVRSIIMQVWLIVSHLFIYVVVAAKHCLWVGAVAWICLVYGISGSFAFSLVDLKYVGVIVLVLSVFMALARMAEVVILVVRGHKMTAAGKYEEAMALDCEIKKHVYNVPGFTFHFAPVKEEVITK